MSQTWDFETCLSYNHGWMSSSHSAQYQNRIVCWAWTFLIFHWLRRHPIRSHKTLPLIHCCSALPHWLIHVTSPPQFKMQSWFCAMQPWVHAKSGFLIFLISITFMLCQKGPNEAASTDEGLNSLAISWCPRNILYCFWPSDWCQKWTQFLQNHYELS